MYTYQSIVVGEKLSTLDIEVIKSKTGDLFDRMGLAKFEKMITAFNQLRSIQEWRSFMLDFELLRIYRSPGGYGNWQDLIDILAIRTIPSWVWEKDRNTQKFMPLRGTLKDAFFESQAQVASAVWLQAPVFWIGKRLAAALNDTKHPGNIPELKLPARSFILALPLGALTAPNNASMTFMVCTSCKMEDGSSGLSVAAWANDEHRTEYFFVVGFSSWDNKELVKINDACDFVRDKDRDREDDFMFELSSFVAKTLLYFNTPTAETVDRATRLRRVKKHPYTTKPSDLWSPNIIGNRIPSPPSPGYVGEGNSRQRAHIVRGHFHTFYTGKGRTETKVTWIMPYWKGIKESA